MPSRFLLPTAALALLGSALYATPTSDEIAAGIDDAFGGIWHATGSTAPSIEIVSDPDAVGGTAVKLTISEGSYGSFGVSGSAGASRVALRYRSDTPLEAISVEEASGEEIHQLAPDDFGSIEWNEAIFLNPSNSGWRLSFEGGEERALYLDGYSATPGFALDLRGWGIDVAAEPQKEFYAPGEWVRVVATPVEGHKFLYWDGWSGGGAPNPWNPVWEGQPNEGVGSVRQFHAVGGAQVEVSGLEVLVPANGVSATEIFEGDEVVGLSISKEGSYTAQAFVDIVGPGYLDFSARRTAGGYGTVNGMALADDWVESSKWFGPGRHRFEILIYYQADVGRFRFREGFPLEVETTGQGSVTGEPADGALSYGSQVELEAEAATGWRFVRWEGSVESTNPKIRVAGYSGARARAIFALPLEFGDLPAEARGAAWAISDDALRAPSELGAGEESSLVWTVQGPGRFELDARVGEGAARLYLDDAQVEFLSDYSGQSGSSSVGVEIESGQHAIRLQLDAGEYFATSYDLAIDDVRWLPGVPVELVFTEGGTASGLPLGISRVEYGVPLQIEASPDEGFAFVEWRGSAEQTEPSLALAPTRPLRLIALFAKTIPGDAILSAQGGFGEWTKSNGNWRSPESLEPGEFASLLARVAGPSRLELKPVSDSGSARVSVRIDGVGQLSAYPGSTSYAFVPEGEHDIEIEVAPMEDVAYSPVEFVGLTLAYRVRLEVENGALTTTPALTQQNFNDPVWSGYVNNGISLTYAATGNPGNAFGAWSGELAGKAASGSVTVDGPIDAIASFYMASFQSETSQWTIEPAGSAYAPKNSLAAIGFNGAAKQVTLSSEVQGPGTLLFSPRGLDLVEAQIDGGDYLAVTDGALEIGPGSHTVKVRATLPEILTDFPLPPHAFGFFGYFEGYLVATQSALGGSVSPASDFFAPGAEVEVVATPDAGNSFVAWLPPFEDRASAFAFDAGANTRFQAIFQAQADLEGLQWTYEGLRPTYQSPTNGSTAGKFRWQFTKDGPHRSASATTTVTGPLVLAFEYNHHDNVTTGAVRKVIIDGDEIATEPGGVLFKTLGPGDHTVSIQVTHLPETGSYRDKYYQTPLPAKRASLTIAASADYAEIASTAEGDEIAAGETVTFTAPEQDGRGATFLGWWWRNQILGRERALSLEAERDMQIVARYGDEMPQAEGILLLPQGFGAWSHEAEAITASTDTDLYFIAEQDLMVSWTTNVSGVGSASIWGPWMTGPAPLAEAGQGPQRASVYLKPGDELRLNVDVANSEAAVVISDIETAPGWSPSYIADREVEIEVGASGALSVGVSLQEAFAGWMDGQRALKRTPAPAMQAGDREILRPHFSRSLASALGEIRVTPAAVWGEDSEAGLPDGDQPASSLAWRGTPSEIGPKESALEFEATGPAILVFKPFGSSLDIAARIDGLDTQTHDWLGDGESKFIQVPAGSRSVALTCASDGIRSIIVSDVRLIEGYSYPLVEFQGGEAFPATRAETYAPGELVEYVAYPSFGYSFAGWENRAGEEARRVTFVAGTNLVPTPIFARDATFSVGGRAWSYRGFKANPTVQSGNTIHSLHLEGPADSWVETEVTGPAVLRVADRYHFDMMLLDGRPLNHPNHVFEFDGDGALLVGVGPGAHRVRTVWPGGAVTNFSGDIFDEFPGSMVVARGDGASVSKSPAAAMYPVGKDIAISANAATVEWSGAPTGSVVVGGAVDFVIPSDSVEVRAASWRPIVLHGMELSFAGNGGFVRTDSGIVKSPVLLNRSRHRLKATGLPAGALAFQFRSDLLEDPHELGIRAFVNGVEVGVPSRQYLNPHAHVWSGMVYLTGEDNEVLWQIDERRLNPAGLYYYVDEMSFELGATHDYFFWLDGYDDRAAEDPERVDTRADIDGDGMPNYLEYLIGSNPVVREDYLSIALEADGAPVLRLRRMTLPQGAGTLALRALYGGASVEPDALLEDPQPDPTDDEVDRRRLLELPDMRKSALFYYDYEGDIPTLDELLSE